MRISVCVSLCLFCFCVSPLHAQQASVKDVVLANEKKFSDLQIQRKCDEAARLLDRNFRAISAEIDDSDDFLPPCKSGEVITTRETFSHVDFRSLTPETALVTYEDDASFLVDGRPITLKAYVASVWVRRGSEWLLSLHTATSIPFVVTDKDKLRLLYSDSAKERYESAVQKDIENQIISLEKRLWNGDASDVAKLEADDYEVIKHAHRYHRADDKAAAKEANFSLVAMDDIHVRMLRSDVALLTYHATEKGSFRGINVSPSLYFGSVWVNRGGEWKNVFLEENLPDAFTDTYLPGSAGQNKQ